MKSRFPSTKLKKNTEKATKAHTQVTNSHKELNFSNLDALDSQFKQFPNVYTSKPKLIIPIIPKKDHIGHRASFTLKS